MALPRATQSAIWYYLSCTPCAEARYRKKLKVKAERDRIEREAMYNSMPHVYRHPSPSGTNAHWQVEIESGPHMISRGKKKPNTSETRGRRLTSQTHDSNGSNGLNSLDLSSSAASRDERNDSKFNFKQYQRDNEQSDYPVSNPPLSSAGSLHSSGITRPPKARMRGTDGEASYATYRHPQVNDLHPATVTKFSSRDEARFMLKALPDPDFMKGKGLAADARGRSDSGGSSRLSVRNPVPLSREVSHKIVEKKIRSADGSLTPNLCQNSPSLAPNDSVGQQPSKDLVEEKGVAQADNTSTGLDDPPTSTQLRGTDNSDESAVTVVHNRDMMPEPLRRQHSRKAASKPQLSTILSDSGLASDENSDHTPLERPKENSNPSPRHSETSTSERNRISRRSPVLAKDDSLQILRDLAPSSAIFNTQVVSTDDLLKASKKPSRLPAPTHEPRTPDFDPEILEAWDTADFELPDWIHEHTKREVKQRWSMDI